MLKIYLKSWGNVALRTNAVGSYEVLLFNADTMESRHVWTSDELAETEFVAEQVAARGVTADHVRIYKYVPVYIQEGVKPAEPTCSTCHRSLDDCTGVARSRKSLDYMNVRTL